MYYEPRQDRKVATVVDTKCAEDVLMESFFMSIKSHVSTWRFGDC